MQQNKLILSCVIVGVVFGAGGFFGGMQYAKASRPTMMRFGGPGGAPGAGGAQFFQRGTGTGGQRGFGGGAAGEVLTKDDKSLTLKLMDGGSKIVYLSPSTTVNKMETGTLEDVSTGANVMVVGSMNQDGSVTASMIQLRNK